MDTDLKKKIDSLPDVPGVYIMRSRKKDVLYVGKAASLRKRVRSYIGSSQKHPKILRLMQRVVFIDYVVCDTEAQALLLEASLIKEAKPRYNVIFKDNKTYPFIEVTREAFPRIFLSRPKSKRGLFLFGPYVSPSLVKEALTLVRRVFPYRSCKKMPQSPCLFYHLSLCPAPCAGYISGEAYQKIVADICRIFSGEKTALINDIEKAMLSASNQNNFEEAALLRDKLIAIQNLYVGKGLLHGVILLKDIMGLPALPLYIEAIDISTLAGEASAGSVVVFRNGSPEKKEYRRYLIKSVSLQDDYRMIAEVVRRRYRRLIAEKRCLPQLVVIDGGKAHANIAQKELEVLGLNIPVTGIAKKEEELWLPRHTAPLIIPRDSPALQLMQRIRDEAHRFAHAYHDVLRKKRCFAHTAQTARRRKAVKRRKT